MSTPKTPSPAQSPSLSLIRFAPLFVFLLALVLRLIGLDWGLPNRERLFSFHPDESVVVGAILRLDPFAGKLDPQFYNYGSGYLLFSAIVVKLAGILGLAVPTGVAGVPSGSELLVCRLVTATLGAATVFPLIAAGRRMAGGSAIGGWIAGGLWTVAPLSVQHSHFATVDIAATFCVAMALSFAARSRTDDVRRFDFLWGGLWAGFAAATKYNAGLVLFSVLLAWWLAKERRVGDALGAVGASMVGFLIGCPGALLNTQKFLADLAFEARHMREGSDNLFTNTLPGAIYHPWINLPFALGAPLALLTLVGIGVAIRRRAAADLVLAVFAVPYFVLIALAEVKFARYTLPLLPPLLLWTAQLAGVSGRARNFARATLAVSALCAFAFSAALLGSMTSPDSRELAAVSIRNSGVRSVGFLRGPWWWSPPLAPGASHFAPSVAKQLAAEFPGPPVLVPASEGDWNAQRLLDAGVDTVALSEFEYADALRLRESAAVDALAQVSRSFSRREIFFRPLAFAGIPLTKTVQLDGWPVQTDWLGRPVPHDMLYTNPITAISRK